MNVQVLRCLALEIPRIFLIQVYLFFVETCIVEGDIDLDPLSSHRPSIRTEIAHGMKRLGNRAGFSNTSIVKRAL